MSKVRKAKFRKYENERYTRTITTKYPPATDNFPPLVRVDWDNAAEQRRKYPLGGRSPINRSLN
jgi:hypothetical protein